MIVAAGSQGQNLRGFAKTLGFNETSFQSTLENTLRLDHYCKPESLNRVELLTASSVWHGKQIVLEEDWANSMRSRFQATIALQGVKEINDWASYHTKGKIPNLVSEEVLTDWDIKLITALYFKAQWTKPFERSSTRNELFYSFDKSMNLCSMMHKTEDLLYQEDEVAQMCVLPYQKNQPGPSLHDLPTEPVWKAAVILPKVSGPEAISSILSHISNAAVLRSLLDFKDAKPQSVALSLPRFTLRSTLDLSQPLSEQGLAPAFKTSYDFAPITQTAPSRIVKVQHDLFVEVNEEGTEVAATTMVTLFGRAVQEAPIEMKVNRPFLFVVFDNVTKLVLCMAVVNEVTAAQ